MNDFNCIYKCITETFAFTFECNTKIFAFKRDLGKFTSESNWLDRISSLPLSRPPVSHSLSSLLALERLTLEVCIFFPFILLRKAFPRLSVMNCHWWIYENKIWCIQKLLVLFTIMPIQSYANLKWSFNCVMLTRLYEYHSGATFHHKFIHVILREILRKGNKAIIFHLSYDFKLSFMKR